MSVFDKIRIPELVYLISEYLDSESKYSFATVMDDDNLTDHIIPDDFSLDTSKRYEYFFPILESESVLKAFSKSKTVSKYYDTNSICKTIRKWKDNQGKVETDYCDIPEDLDKMIFTQGDIDFYNFREDYYAPYSWDELINNIKIMTGDLIIYLWEDMIEILQMFELDEKEVIKLIKCAPSFKTLSFDRYLDRPKVIEAYVEKTDKINGYLLEMNCNLKTTNERIEDNIEILFKQQGKFVSHIYKNDLLIGKLNRIMNPSLLSRIRKNHEINISSQILQMNHLKFM